MKLHFPPRAMIAVFLQVIAWPSSAASGPDQPPSREKVIAQADELYFHRDQAGNLTRSSRLLEGWILENPDDAVVLWRLGRNLLQSRECYIRTEERLPHAYERARELLERSLRADDGSAQAHYWYALVLGKIGEGRGMFRGAFLLPKIKSHLRAALRRNPDFGDARLMLAEILWRVPPILGGSKARAIRELYTALRLAPNDTSLHLALGIFCAEAGRKEEAVRVFRLLLETKQPEDPTVLPKQRRIAEHWLDALNSAGSAR